MGEHGMSTYDDSYIKGTEYQDFIITEMLKKGFPICSYSSKKYQFNHGESANGIEIKFDGMMAKTGNLYIEIAEKTNSLNFDYVASGIMRMDNTWAYLIGDYSEAFLLGIGQLRSVWSMPKEKKKQCGVQERETPTSRGFTIPKNGRLMKDWLCLRYFTFGKY
jgi:hypothetical protein